MVDQDEFPAFGDQQVLQVAVGVIDQVVPKRVLYMFRLNVSGFATGTF